MPKYAYIRVDIKYGRPVVSHTFVTAKDKYSAMAKGSAGFPVEPGVIISNDTVIELPAKKQTQDTPPIPKQDFDVSYCQRQNL